MISISISISGSGHVPTDRPAFTRLALKEIGRYARHPLFILGAVLTFVSCFGQPDPSWSSYGNTLVVAAAIGLFGVAVMASLVRSSDRAAEAAGTVTTGQRTRTLALAVAVVVPFAAGLAWFAWAVWAYHRWPPVASGTPFGGIGDGWFYAVLFDLGVLACVGGPILGLVLARWLPRRGVVPVAMVLLVLATIVMQGLFEPLRTIRLVMPWTHFTGPFGIAGDPERMVILTGSPYWYGVYLALLCAGGVLVAMLRDREQPRTGLARALGVVAAVAALICVLAITGGVQQTRINPVSSTSST